MLDTRFGGAFFHNVADMGGAGQTALETLTINVLAPKPSAIHRLPSTAKQGQVRFVRRLYNYYLHPEKELARRLHGLVGFTPTHLALFKLAFYHKSTFTTRDYAISNNERLEFLGDAVLSTIVGEYLFKKYPNSDEGFLTKMRSKIVKRNSLDDIADKMGLDLFLAHYNQTRLSKSMLGNALEALVGAVYIELGYEKTRNFVIRKILRRYLDIHELEVYDDNFKSQLLEWCQKNGKNIDYKVMAKYKADKRDKFKVAVFVDGRKLGTADDFNKKAAEQLASERAMQMLGIIGGVAGATVVMPQGDEEGDEGMDG
jgi:ribonuclease III